MKAVITEVKFLKEIDSQFGKLFSFQVSYDNERAIYRSKYKDQKKFVTGQEAEFTEEMQKYTDKKTGEEKEYKVIKPINLNKQSNFGKALKKEQSRYSGFAVSYAKDLVVAGRLPFNELLEYSSVLFEHMVTLDKTLDT